MIFNYIKILTFYFYKIKLFFFVWNKKIIKIKYQKSKKFKIKFLLQLEY